MRSLPRLHHQKALQTSGGRHSEASPGSNAMIESVHQKPEWFDDLWWFLTALIHGMLFFIFFLHLQANSEHLQDRQPTHLALGMDLSDEVLRQVMPMCQLVTTRFLDAYTSKTLPTSSLLNHVVHEAFCMCSTASFGLGAWPAVVISCNFPVTSGWLILEDNLKIPRSNGDWRR